MRVGPTILPLSRKPPSHGCGKAARRLLHLRERICKRRDANRVAMLQGLQPGATNGGLSTPAASWAALAALAFMVLLVLTQERAMTLTHVKFTKCQHLLWCNVPLGDGFASTGFPKLRRFHNHFPVAKCAFPNRSISSQR
jgi:hypothetical protein